MDDDEKCVGVTEIVTYDGKPSDEASCDRYIDIDCCRLARKPSTVGNLTSTKGRCRRLLMGSRERSAVMTRDMTDRRTWRAITEHDNGWGAMEAVECKGQDEEREQARCDEDSENASS